MEVSEVRRRLRAAVEDARRSAAERRARTDAAARAYEEFLEQRAVPVFHQFAAALTAEGHLFKVFTPANSVRLASERSHEEFIELTLNDASDPPTVVGHTSRGRGRRMISSERPVREHVAVADLTEEDVLSFLLVEITHVIER
ncbi:MAG: hypothetical protein M3545_18200 [Acidobacteriota bacterium]|nr:hypothetical protein [Acidobacteriota bacterium]